MALATDHPPTPLNTMLASLSSRDLDQFRACLFRVPLARDQVLAQHDQPIDHAFFMMQQNQADNIIASSSSIDRPRI